MPELRQNFFTKKWVIIATERAKRPEELAMHRPAQEVPAFVETCPFCPGNEIKTPPEVMCHPTDGGPWQVRVFPNKFAALASDVQPVRSLQHLRRRVSGFGFHEVIVDSPDHARCMAMRCGIASMRHCVTTTMSESACFATWPSARSRPRRAWCSRTSLLSRWKSSRRRRRLPRTSSRCATWRALATSQNWNFQTWRGILRALLARIYVRLENPDLNFTIRSGPAENARRTAFSLVCQCNPPAQARGRVRNWVGNVHQHGAAGGCGRVPAEGCHRQDGGWGREVRACG